MTVVQVGGAVLSFRLDWSRNHLLNPLWHPHARFHGALLLFMLAGVAATSVWSMWRRSSEPGLAVRQAALLSLAFWTPLFYITTLVPGSTSWAGAPAADPRLAGQFVTPNLVVALAFTVVNLTMFWLARDRRTTVRSGTLQAAAAHARGSRAIATTHPPEPCRAPDSGHGRARQRLYAG